jgi:hypothetical protein
MFQPSREEVRRFFLDAWSKHRTDMPASPLERIAIRWILQHPEYHALLDDPETALAADFAVEGGRGNPFLHLAMHVSLEEQSSIDQPPGIRSAIERLVARHGSRHAADHEAMECLGEIVWRAQRRDLPPDTASINELYLECLARRTGFAAG